MSPGLVDLLLDRYQKKRFRKAQCPLVERLVNSLMMHGRNSGKKIMALRIVKHAFEIIALMTDKNPIQVLKGGSIGLLTVAKRKMIHPWQMYKHRLLMQVFCLSGFPH